ncbi:MAG: anthranilate synthase component I family protein [Algoriphagus sp.]|nr:anthranilate synthase component I family protein [Algoriphagus sp.]
MTSFPFSYPFPGSHWVQKLIYWAQQEFTYLAYFNGNDYPYPKGNFGNTFFAGNKPVTAKELWDPSKGVFKVGIIGYDFKNHRENLQSSNPAFLDLPEICFFQPELLIKIENDKVLSKTELTQEFWNSIERSELPQSPNLKSPWTAQISKEKYLESVETIKSQIVEGETYEMNFCQAFSGEFESWDPVAAYFKLNEISPMPFSALFKAGEKWIISASPERFIKKTGSQIIAQPIKGTIRRGITAEEDLENRNKLGNSEKEKAENLMITDLMRNDLSKVSKTGTVKVDELFGIYQLPKVFQMISTISSEVNPEVAFEDIIQATFPMGSMTGAPKIRTMELIDELESFKRGWFSGALGWVDEEGDFDFSVVIRSIIANLIAKKLYFGVGSAVTFDADPEQEFEECQLKAQAIFEILRGA